MSQEQENYGFMGKPLSPEEKEKKAKDEKAALLEKQKHERDGVPGKDTQDADNRFEERKRIEKQREQAEKSAKEAKEKEAKEKAKKAQEKDSKGNQSWLKRSVTSDLAKAAKTVTGKELMGENSLTSSLAKMIEKGQEKAMQKLEKEKEDREKNRENTR